MPAKSTAPVSRSTIAQAKGRVRLRLVDFRDFSRDRHRTVDDRPYGGGPGMVMLAQPLRGHIRYRVGDEVLLYFLDTHAYPPETVGVRPDGSTISGVWVSGAGRADIIVRTEAPFRALAIEADSPIATDLIVSVGGRPVTARLLPGKTATFSVPASGVGGWRDFSALLSVRSTRGFVPRMVDASSNDGRNLGANLRFQPVR